MDVIVLTVMGRLPSWNSHLARSGWKYTRTAQEWRLKVHHALMGAGLLGVRLGGGLVVHVIRFGSPVVDVDNVMAKVVVDGLKHAGLLQEDNPTVVSRIVVDSFPAKRKDTRVEIRISRLTVDNINGPHVS